MNANQIINIVRGVLEELADTLPEVRDTELWRENMRTHIDSWNDWNIIVHENDPKKINQWFMEQLAEKGIESRIESLGGSMQGVGIYGETLHAIFTDDHGLGIYVNGDENHMPSPYEPVFMFKMDASTRLMYDTPNEYAQAMAELLAVTLFSIENFGGKR